MEKGMPVEEIEKTEIEAGSYRKEKLEHSTKDKIHLVNVRYKELSWVNHIHIWSLSITDKVPSIDS